MRQLHPIGLTSDRGALILAGRRGAQSGSYLLNLSDELLEQIEDARAVQPAEELKPARSQINSALSPRDIQRRLRAGRSIQEVAAEAGVEIEWVERFAAPILAEQAAAVSRAGRTHLQTARRGMSERPLEAAVLRNLADRNIRMTEEEIAEAWSASHLIDDDWVITFRFRSRGRLQTAEWVFNPSQGTLIARNRVGTELGFVDPARSAPAEAVDAPAAGAAPAGRAGRRRTGPRKTAARRAPARKAPGRKTTARKTTAGKAPARRATARKATAGAAPAKRPTAASSARSRVTKADAGPGTTTKRPTGKRPTGKRAATKRAATKRRPAQDTPAERASASTAKVGAAPVGRSAARKSTIAKSTAAKKSALKKGAARKSAPRKTSAAKKTAPKRAAAAVTKAPPAARTNPVAKKAPRAPRATAVVVTANGAGGNGKTPV